MIFKSFVIKVGLLETFFHVPYCLKTYQKALHDVSRVGSNPVSVQLVVMILTDQTYYFFNKNGYCRDVTDGLTGRPENGCYFSFIYI